VQHSRSIRERSSALNRATGALKGLQGRLDDCPQPERVVVDDIVQRWLDLVLGVASDVGTVIAREPVTSPYIVGAPVPSDRLVGREAVLDQIRAAWAKPGQRDSLVVYGHRRMGKTSVLRNIVALGGLGEATGLAYINLQTVDWSESLADLCHAIAFALWQAAPEGAEGPEAAAYQDHPVAALRQFMAQLDNPEQARRYILVLDEYELLDSALPGDAGSQFTTLLRGLSQQYPWLVVALVGLHDLKERSASVYHPIYAWRPVRVSFLDADGVADVLQVEDDAFPLAYSQDAIARIHELTGGQPFLVQLLDDSLVQRFNQRLRAELHPPPATISEEDVAAVVETQALYEHGAVYFRGIWEQAGAAPPGQQALLRTLAVHPQGLDAEHLQRATNLAQDAQAAALEGLRDHDVVIFQDGHYRFTVELMRRWVAADMMDRGPVDGVA
jgi:hypothetical protein